MDRPASGVRPSTISNFFSSETAWPIKAKFYVEPPWEGGTKVYINGPGHMTKMAAMPIQYNPDRTRWSGSTELMRVIGEARIKYPIFSGPTNFYVYGIVYSMRQCY